MRALTKLAAIAGVWCAFTLATLLALADEVSCPPMSIGVHVVKEGTSNSYVAIAKAIPLNEDDGSFSIAEAEARLEAKSSLMNHLSPDLKKVRFSGLVEVSVCWFKGEVFATLRLDEANAKRAAKMQDLMRDSLKNSPTPRP